MSKRFFISALGKKTNAASVPLLLDTYSGAEVAFSVRKLRTAYSGSCMQIVRYSDAGTQDIGFDSNGYLDTAAIISFCGAEGGYVKYWYDQSGNERNMDKLSANLQPTIYDGASIVTDNGKAAIQMSDLVDTDLRVRPGGYKLPIASSTVGVVNCTSGGGTQYAWGQNNNNTTNNYLAFGLTSDDFYGPAFGEQASSFYKTTVAGSQQVLFSLLSREISDPSYEFDFWLNGVKEEDATTATARSFDDASNLPDANVFGVGALVQDSGNPTFRQDGYVQEIIAWESDQSSNIAAIMQNINNYFGVY